MDSLCSYPFHKSYTSDFETPIAGTGEKLDIRAREFFHGVPWPKTRIPVDH